MTDTDSVAYRAFVDEMAKVARTSMAAKRIRAHGHPVRTNDADLALSSDEAALRAVFLRLTENERGALAKAFEDERRSALHDLAAFFHWAAVCDELDIRWKGQAFGESPYNTMHADLICRLEGDDWSDFLPSENS